MFIDSHCHPDDEAFADDREAMLARAAAAGVATLVAIGGGGEAGTLALAIELAERHDPEPAGQAAAPTSPLPRIWATVGVHPHEARRADAASFGELAGLARHPRVIAVGEIGLDYHYDHSPRATQQRVFERQLEIAAEAGLPVSIHCHEAFADCQAAIERAQLPAAGVYHCFSEDWAAAERALAAGFYLSFSGIVTFAKAAALREVAQRAPADRLLIETDAPYLAPVPYRGKRNEPAWVAQVAAKLAEVRGWTLEETARQTRANFARLFSRTAGARA